MRILPDNPLVLDALAQIRALRKLSRENNVRTTLTQNRILQALPPEILAIVALELSKDGGAK
jgi:hypothetical protein